MYFIVCLNRVHSAGAFFFVCLFDGMQEEKSRDELKETLSRLLESQTVTKEQLKDFFVQVFKGSDVRWDTSCFAGCTVSPAGQVLGSTKALLQLGSTHPARIEALLKLRVELPVVKDTVRDLERGIKFGANVDRVAFLVLPGNHEVKELHVMAGKGASGIRQLTDWRGRESWVLLDGANETDQELCSLKLNEGRIELNCDGLFERNERTCFQRRTLSDGDEIRVSDVEFKFESRNKFDLDDAVWENAFDPRLLYQLLAIGGHHLAVEEITKDRCTSWSNEAGAMLVELTKACFERCGRQLPICNDEARFLTLALKDMYTSDRTGWISDVWMKALAVSLPYFLMDLFVLQRDFVSDVCAKHGLATEPKETDFKAASDQLGRKCSLRVDGRRQKDLDKASVELNREFLGGSISVSTNKPACVRLGKNGQWWLNSGNTTVSVIGSTLPCSVWTPLYHGCCLKIGAHVVVFSDDQHAHMVEEFTHSEAQLLQRALDLGSECSPKKKDPRRDEAWKRRVDIQKEILGVHQDADTRCAWALCRLLLWQPCNDEILPLFKEKIQVPIHVPPPQVNRHVLMFSDKAKAEACAAFNKVGVVEMGVFEKPKEERDVTHILQEPKEGKTWVLVPLPMREARFIVEILSNEKVDVITPNWKRGSDFIPLNMREKKDEQKFKVEEGAVFATMRDDQKTTWLGLVLNMFRNLNDHWSQFQTSPEICTQLRGIRRFVVAYLSSQPKFRAFLTSKYNKPK